MLQLSERFGQDKVYVLGESWGVALGIMLVQRYPELFHAFIGTGQMVAFLENDRMCYDFALDWAQERGDVEEVGRLTNRDRRLLWSGRGLAGGRVPDGHLQLHEHEPGHRQQRHEHLPRSGHARIRAVRQGSWSAGCWRPWVWSIPQLWDVDFRSQARKLDVPVYFLIGRHDINAPTVLAEQYYDLLDTPYKQVIWFEHSGHTPWVSESERFAGDGRYRAGADATTLSRPT